MIYRIYMVTALFLGILFIVFQLYAVHHFADKSFSVANTPIILWWTPFGHNGEFRTCGEFQCYFTHNRSYQQDTHLNSILFYGSNLRVNDLPNWKSNHVSWGLLHEESPRNNPILVHKEALNLFTYSATFSRFSDVPLTLLDLPGKEQLLGKKYLVPTKKKTELIEAQNFAPLLYIQSDCNTASNRDKYVLELMKYIKIDSYGSCINNAQLHDSLKDNYLDILKNDEFLSFVARYKFTIAFENAICNDYITEKLWRPLIVGSVPIYSGSPTFTDWLPNNKSAISILDFTRPKDLANYLHLLIANDTAYDEYLSHKLADSEKRLTNKRLMDALDSRRDIANDFGSYVDEFECFICRKAHMAKHKLTKNMVTESHYNCPLPRDLLTHKTDEDNWWVHQWTIEKCGAKLLAHYVSNNLSIDIAVFTEQKLNLYDKNDCQLY